MRICIFGDSVTYAGYIKNSWANLLRWHFEEHNKDGFQLYNLGINGATAPLILERIEEEALVRTPDRIIIAVGKNDSGYIKSEDSPVTSMKTFNNSLQTISQLKLHVKPRFLFVGIGLGDESLLQPFKGSHGQESYNVKRTDSYNKAIKSFSNEQGHMFVDAVQKLEHADFKDGLHPNESGHKKIFEEIIKEKDFFID